MHILTIITGHLIIMLYKKECVLTSSSFLEMKVTQL